MPLEGARCGAIGWNGTELENKTPETVPCGHRSGWVKCSNVVRQGVIPHERLYHGRTWFANLMSQ